jgi:hypothetical protein
MCLAAFNEDHKQVIFLQAGAYGLKLPPLTKLNFQ